MKTIYHLSLLLITVMLFSSCGSTLRYTATDAPVEFKTHKTIAVLPVELVLKGKDYPKDWDEDKITQFETDQSEIYQSLMYEALLRKFRTTKGVKIQSIDNTMEILKDKRLDVKDIWTEDESRLAQMLGVDAVVRTKIEQVRYMSDRQAMNVSAATNAIIWGAPAFYPYGGISPRTATLRTTCAIVDGKNSKVLWRMGVKRDTQWNNPPKEVAFTVFRKMARNFPYSE
ncbi:MAG: hypothetical protein K1X92_07645 [Bacteroidia bacterium]|nr:hypothetical protein [Bacteroidia bacterium]